MSGLAAWLHAFLGNVQRDGECWIWTGRLNQGYGIHGGKVAHREAYKRIVGDIPEGLELDHLCRRPACVNPLHMQPVTRVENRRRRYAAQTHCRNGHEFSPGNTYITSHGSRSCKACQRAAAKRYRERKQPC